jgi:hypothetical protein
MCDLEMGACITGAVDDHLLIGIEVTPKAETTGRMPITRLIGPHEIGGPTRLDMVLPGHISVFGDVCKAVDVTDGTVCAFRVSAALTFSRAGFVEAGRAVVLETTTAADPQAAPDGEPADFVARLVRDQEYDVLIEPNGDAAALFPPVWRRIRTPPEGDITRIQLLQWKELVTLSGETITELETPFSGLQVRAVDRVTGRAVSSTVITDELGKFELALDPTATDYVVRLNGGPDRPLFPTLVQDPSFFFPGVERHTILVPDLDHVIYNGRVAKSGAAARDPIEGAALTFRSDDVFDGTTGVHGSFRTTAMTNSDGTFSVDLLPGTYEVLVTPPSSRGDLAVLLQTSNRIEPSAEPLNGMTFELEARRQLSGVVRTADERTMSSAAIQATALGRALEDAGEAVRASRYNRSGDTTSDPVGNFTLPLDVGVYDVVVKPPSESRFPWIIHTAVPVIQSTEQNPRFEAPLPVSGRIVDEDGMPVAGADLRAVGIVTEPSTDTRRSVVVGRAVTDANGDYRLLLPPRF